MTWWPDGVRKVDEIEEGGVLISLSEPADLDELLVAVRLYLIDRAVDDGDYESAAGWWAEEPDKPTNLRRFSVDIAWHRKVPCPPNICGEHSWHMHRVGEEPTGTRGEFLAVYVD